MELNDPLIESVLIHMYLIPKESTSENWLEKISRRRSWNAFSRTVWSGESNEIVYGGFLPRCYQMFSPILLSSVSALVLPG